MLWSRIAGSFQFIFILLALSPEAWATLPGKYVDIAVDRSPSGRLLHTVPVDVPVGIDGFSPKLSLGYENDRPLSLLGHGWRIDGISSVSRCSRTLAQDGAAGGVTYEISDRLCLDGNRILTPTPGLSGSAADAAYHAFSSDTTLELDAFARIRRINGLLGIEVNYKDGLTAYYGNYDGSHANACQVVLVTGSGNTCGEFKLARLENRRTGDYADYQYLVSGNISHPEKVTYGVVGDYRSVVLFQYEVRPDSRAFYVGDIGHSLTQRLKKITSYTVSPTGSSFDAYRINIDYVSDTARAAIVGSELSSIEKCRIHVDQAGLQIPGQQSECLEKVNYQYEASSGFSSYTRYETTSDNLVSGIFNVAPFGVSTGERMYDVNGDGLPDIIKGGSKVSSKACSACAWTTTYYEPEVFLNTGGRYQKHVGLSNSLKDKGIYFTRIIQDVSVSPIFRQELDVVNIADINGDGYMDIVFAYNTTSGLGTEEINKIYTYSPSGAPQYLDSGRTTPWGTFSAMDGMRQGVTYTDINGDGLDDIVVLYKRNGSSVQGVFINTGSGFTDTSPEALSYRSSILVTNLYENEWSGGVERSWGTRLMDINGDGLPDIVQLYSDNGTKYNRVYLNNPRSSAFEYSLSYSQSLTNVFMASYNAGTPLLGSLRFVDLNADGLPDVIMDGQVKNAGSSPVVVQSVLLNTGKKFVAHSGYSSSIQWGLYYATGNTTSFVFFGKRLAPDQPFPDRMDNAGGVSFADVNGDGLPDQVKVVYRYVNTSTGYTRDTALVRLNNGQGFVSSSYASNLLSIFPSQFNPNCILGGCETYRSVRFMDLNGDGLSDMYTQYGFSSSTLDILDNIYLARHRRVGLLRSVNSGQREVAVDYVLNNTSLAPTSYNLMGPYPGGVTSDRTIAATEKYRFIRSPNLFLSSLKEKTGTYTASAQPERRLTSYALTNPIVSEEGRGFLGFEKIASEVGLEFDTSKTLRTETQWLTAFPYTGMPQKRVQTVNGIKQREENFTLDTLLRGSAKHPYVKQVSSATHDPLTAGNPLLSSEVTTVTLDSLGNALARETVVSEILDGMAVTHADRSDATYLALIDTATRWEPSLLKTDAKTLRRTRAGSLVSEKTQSRGYAYDGNGRPTHEYVEPTMSGGNPLPGTSETSYTVEYQRDGAVNGFGLVVSSRITGGIPRIHRGQALDSLVSRRTDTLYDASRRFGVRKTRYTDVAGGLTLVTEETGHDPLHGNPSVQKDANNLQTQLTHDAWGRKTGAIYPEGTQDTWLYTWCSGGEPCIYKRTTQLSGQPETVEQFDRFARKTKDLRQHDMPGAYAKVDYEYDGHGRLKRQSRPYLVSPQYHHLFQYDVLDREKLYTRPDGKKITTLYERLVKRQFDQAMPNASVAGHGCGNTVVSLGETRREVSDAQGLLYQVYDACGGMTQFTHDALGNRTEALNAKGQLRTWTYDNYSRLLAEDSLDSGISEYAYDVLDNRILALTALQRADLGKIGTLYFYDDLGRQTKRQEDDLVSQWSYGTSTGNKGLLHKVTADNGYERTHAYDAFSRPSQTIIAKAIDPHAQPSDPDFMMGTTYDPLGRPENISYPTGFSYRNIYDDRGYLKEVRETGTDRLYWRAETRDAEGRVTKETLGNGVVTARSYKPETGQLDTVITGPLTGSAPAGDVQNDVYAFDSLGNLTLRNHAVPNVLETYSYDGLSRLVRSIQGNQGSIVSYDGIGNILGSNEIENIVGPVSGWAYTATSNSYIYSGCGGSHRVCSINGQLTTSFTYDANGNMLTGNGRSYAWASYNLPTMITQGSTVESFLYTADHERIRRSQLEGGQTSTTVYLNPRIDLGGTFEKTYRPDGAVEHNHHVYAGNKLVGSMISTGGVGTPVILWSTGIDVAPTTSSNNPVGVTMPSSSSDPHGLISWSNTLSPGDAAPGRLLFLTKPASSSNPFARGQRTYGNQNVLFRAEITTTQNQGTKGRYIKFGVSNGGSSAVGELSARAHYLVMNGTNAEIEHIDGNHFSSSGTLVRTTVDLEYTISDDTTYVVEVETMRDSSMLYLYPKGLSRADGVRHAMEFDWRGPAGTLNRHFRAVAYATSGHVLNETYLDNLSEIMFTPVGERYFHYDHIGSVSAITDKAGKTVERLSYNEWGKRRHQNGAADIESVPVWEANFSENPANATSGIGMPESDLNELVVWDESESNGRLAFSNRTISVAEKKYVVGQRYYNGDDKVIFRAEITTTINAGALGRQFSFGLFPHDCRSATPTHYYAGRHSFALKGNELHTTYVYRRVPQGSANISVKHLESKKLDFEIEDNTTYVIEISRGKLSSQAYFYKKGHPRASGVISQSIYAHWTNANHRWCAQVDAGPDHVSNVTYLDKVSEISAEYPSSTIKGQATDRGYTLHEHLDGVGLIHMNARLYDPLVGRFLSPDPVLAYPDDPRDLNRYSYVWNNPLSMVDPSGAVMAPAALPCVDSCFNGFDLMPAAQFWSVSSSPDVASMQWRSYDASYMKLAAQELLATQLLSAAIAESISLAAQRYSQVMPGRSRMSAAIPTAAPYGVANSAGTRGYRYVTEAEVQAIKETGMLRGGRPGETFFTKDVYKSGAHAQDRLSLPSTPTHRIEFEITNNPAMMRNGAKVEPVGPYSGRGAEFMTTDPVRVNLINVQPLR